MRRIAVINQKGGVGKTTTTANLGAALARSGSRVLLIDFDPQAHLSLHFGVELSDDQPSIYDVLTASVPIQDVSLNVHDSVTLIPADIDLAGAEAELISVTGREVLLREALEAIGDDYDCLLIDGPPSLGVLTINALVAANEVMIPLQAHFLALQGLSKLLDTVTLVRQRINPDLTVGGIVLCMHEFATRLAGEVVEDLVRFLEGSRGSGTAWADARVYDTYIRRNIKLAESSSFGQTVFDYAPRSNGAIDYARLALEVFGETTVALEHAATPNTLSSRQITGTNPKVDAATRPDTPGPAEVSASTSTAPVEERLPSALPDDAVADRAARRDTVTSTP
ncbi:MAG: ParA family protein [Phycisphaerales bacterium]|nr:MAG: ParA family protein [Phycisphaerales bacterium]